MSTKFVRTGCHYHNPKYVKAITCNGPKARGGCAVIIANTEKAGGNAGHLRDRVVEFICDDWSKCSVRNSGICTSRSDE